MDGDQVVCEVCGQVLPALYRTVGGRTLCVEADHPAPAPVLGAAPLRVSDGGRPSVKRGWPRLRGVPQQG